MAETNKHLKGVFLVAQPQFFLYWFASEILRKHYKIFATSWRENAHVHLVTLMPQLDCCGRMTGIYFFPFPDHITHNKQSKNAINQTQKQALDNKFEILRR